MEIIQQLGINGTALIQFGIFICAFFFLNLYLFTPYYKALEERENRTLGGEDLALEFQKKSKIRTITSSPARAFAFSR